MEVGEYMQHAKNEEEITGWGRGKGQGAGGRGQGGGGAVNV